MKILSYGGGVNSTALLAMIKLGALSGVDCAVFADTGAEKQATYDYLDYIKDKSPIPIITVKSKEGSLWDYCEQRRILPMRFMRWCTDRWKKKPLSNWIKNSEVKITSQLIGIDYGEKSRLARWASLERFEFPLMDKQYNRRDCEKLIKKVGWKLPVKSGCVFCPFANPREFAELKVNEPERFKQLCELEGKTLARFTEYQAKGWFNPKYPLAELVSRKFPATDPEQTNLCLYCMS